MKLVHNKPISRRTDYKTNVSQSMIYTYRDALTKKQTTEKPDRVYFLWFLYLKLLLELEEKKIGLEIGRDKKKIYVGRHIKIDKTFYKDWDLDEVLKNPFWKWWRTHRNLFENKSIETSNSPNSWTPKPHFRFMRIDMRKNFTTIKKDFLKEMDDHKGKVVDAVSSYKVLGKPSYDGDILRYNVLVRILNGNDDEEILENERGRMKRNANPKKGISINEGGKKESDLWHQEREWRKLTPEQKAKKYKDTYHEVHRTSPEIDGERKHYSDEGKTKREREYAPDYETHINFRTILRKYLSRWTNESHKILNGVAQGKFRQLIEYEVMDKKNAFARNTHLQ
ncbi:hypothetical protein OAJ98_02265 [Deltaproteobacteria bacterium]|nr:hypothetical protein [Deltaproteobacteria bacterium]